MAVTSAVRREHTEGQIAKSIESQTAKLPSDTFLWAAVAAIGVSARSGRKAERQHVRGPVGADVPDSGDLQQAGEAGRLRLHGHGGVGNGALDINH